MQEKSKTKMELKLPEIRKAGEGEEGKWKNTIPLNKKTDDVYIQAAEAEPKKATTAAAQPVEKDTKNKKGQVLELDLPRLRKQPRENKRDYKDGNSRDGSFKDGNFRDGNFKDGNFKNSNLGKDGPKKGSFKKSDAVALTLDEKSFPYLPNTA